MLRCAVLVVTSLVCNSAFAQQAPSPAPPQEAAAPAQPDKPVVQMEEPQPGDHWTYEIRDEITGTITATRENVVTEVSPTEISVRFKRLGSSEEGLNVYVPGSHALRWNLPLGQQARVQFAHDA